jgi:hypothetical protein
VSKSTFIPSLAGMDPAVIFKQLDDYRSGKRPWGVMGAIAKALSIQGSADVAAYFAARPNGLAAIARGGVLRRESGSKESASARRLAFMGDEKRGMPPWLQGRCLAAGRPIRRVYRAPASGFCPRAAPERYQRANAHDRHPIDAG